MGCLEKATDSYQMETQIKIRGVFFWFGVYLYNLVYFDKPVGSRKKYDPGRVSKLNTLNELNNDFVTKLKIISIDLLYGKNFEAS